MDSKKKLLNHPFFCILLAIIPVVLVVICDMFLCAEAVHKYRQFVIEKTELIGKNEKNLKDFQLEEDGSLVSQSDDPWIEYVMNEAQYVKTIDIFIDSIIPERTYAEVYLVLEDGSGIYFPFFIHSGINKIQFKDINKINKACTIRLDLVSQADCAVIVDKIIVNDRISVTIRYHLYTVSVIIFILCLALIARRVKTNQFSGFRELSTGAKILSANLFLLFVFAPLDLYFNNKGEFWFDLYTLLPIVLIMFFAGTVIGSIILIMLFLIHNRLYQTGVLFLFISFLCSYIQGNFLVNNLPPLDGSVFDWADYSGERFRSIIIWLLLALVVGVLLKYMHLKKLFFVIERVSFLLIGMLSITLCIECFSKNGYQSKLNADITVKNQFDMSKTENFIILVLDTLDAGVFDTVMENHQEYKESFSDFTYFPDTMGAYSFTSRSIPFILSGNWYENQISFEKYLLDVYEDSTLFSELENRDYRLGLYETTIPLTSKDIYRFENVLECDTEITSYMDFVKLELRLIGFRYAPFDIKRFCALSPSEFELLKANSKEVLYQRFSDDNLQFYKNIQSQPITYTNQKSFKFIHIEGAHVPYRYDQDVNRIENGTYEQNIEASMTIVGAYLKKLKDSEVYDNSVIIIMSDHGYAHRDDLEYGRQNPLFMIKGRNEHHNMHTSQAPISYDDLQAAYIKLLDGATADEAFVWQEGDKRERRFLFYWYLEENYMVEYIQTGEASDPTMMVPTGVVYSR